MPDDAKLVPGVFVEETTGPRQISGVPTSNTAFVGFFARGPVDRAVCLTDFREFERDFGGLDRRSAASYAVRHYFLNGGGTALIVRVTGGTGADGATSARRAIGPGLTIEAVSPGAWGNALQTAFEPAGSGRFHLYVREMDAAGRRVTASGVYRNVTLGAPLSAWAGHAGIVRVREEDPERARASLDAEVTRSVHELVLSAAARVLRPGAVRRLKAALRGRVRASVERTLGEALRENLPAIMAAMVRARGDRRDAFGSCERPGPPGMPARCPTRVPASSSA